MASQAGTRAGWKVLMGAAQDLLDPRLRTYAEAEQARRLKAFQKEVSCRVGDTMPQGQNQRLIQMVVDATAAMFAMVPHDVIGQWPDDVYDYVLNHGGIEGIDKIIAANPLLAHIECDCARKKHVLLYPDIQTKEMHERQRQAGSAGSRLIELLFGPNFPFEVVGTDVDGDPEEMTEFSRQLRDMERMAERRSPAGMGLGAILLGRGGRNMGRPEGGFFGYEDREVGGSDHVPPGSFQDEIDTERDEQLDPEQGETHNMPRGVVPDAPMNEPALERELINAGT